MYDFNVSQCLHDVMPFFGETHETHTKSLCGGRKISIKNDVSQINAKIRETHQ
jgi:hypothetical protein